MCVNSCRFCLVVLSRVFACLYLFAFFNCSCTHAIIFFLIPLLFVFSAHFQCDFVTQRLDAGMDPKSITNEVLHFCLADDPGKSAGIGADNMTFMVVLLHKYVE